MPRIFIIDDPAPNAFATGRNTETSAVAVTSGLLKMLNRDELQGVIAHEISHIQNWDVLLMVMAGVMVGSIVIIADLGVRAVFYGGGRRSRSSSGGNQIQIIIIVVAIVLAILSPFIAQFIYFAISRNREYLADASSAQYTRYPEGLASALEKIGASTMSLSRVSKASAPMYIVNPIKPEGMQLKNVSRTHPPITERIQILRSMAGGASYVDYEGAFRKIHGTGKGIIPKASLGSAGAVGLVGGTGEPPVLSDEVKHKREVQDAVWKANKFQIINCDCGTVLKVPPKFKSPEIKCPHCGRIHEVKK